MLQREGILYLWTADEVLGWMIGAAGGDLGSLACNLPWDHTAEVELGTPGT